MGNENHLDGSDEIGVMTCEHRETLVVQTRGFRGPVSRDENRAAHGAVTHEERCASCGALRLVNVNQRAVEIGPWGPSVDARRQAAREADRTAERLRAEVGTITLDGLTYSVDPDGLIVADSDVPRRRAEADLQSDAAAQFLQRAQRARRAVIEAERAWIAARLVR